MGQGDRVACILELTEQLGQGDQLTRVGSAAQFKQVLQERRFFNPGHLQDVTLDVGFDQGITDILSPAGFVADQAGRTRVAPEIDVLVQ